MPRKTLLIYSPISLVVIGLLVLMAYLQWGRGVSVSVTNKTQNGLMDMKIYYTGGHISHPQLAPETSYRTHVNPNGESDLKIEWTDSLGVRQSHKIDVYFERNYAGSIKITVEPDNSVSVIDEVNLLGPF